VSPTEAAFVTGLSAKAVNATIDRREIAPRVVRRRGGNVTRRLGVPELVYLALRPKLTGVSSARARRRVYEGIRREMQSRGSDVREVLSGSCAGSTAVSPAAVDIDVVTVHFDAALSQVVERMRLLAAAEQHVISDPEIRAGEPVVRGTRVPVYRLAELAARGVSEQELLEDHPAVSREALHAALTYARTHPRRGRPKQAPWHRANAARGARTATRRRNDPGSARGRNAA
jgi:uncharacterized protein (DUF433 family)